MPQKLNRVLWKHITRHLAGKCLREKQCIFQSCDKGGIWIILRPAADGYRDVLQLMCLTKIKLKHRAMYGVSLLTCFINPLFLLEFWSLSRQRAWIQFPPPSPTQNRCSHHLRKTVMKKQINVSWSPQTSSYLQSRAIPVCSLYFSWLGPLSCKLRE